MTIDLHEANRLSWNAATIAHNSHKGDQAAFFRSGGTTLFPEELDLLGDIAGKELLHLQCNAGQDSLSLAQRGARVTGVDISDEAIDFAKRLSADALIPAQFERADLFTWFEQARQQHRTFDRVFASYGTICWLSDIDTWARGIASVLKPGGQFSFIEFHPFALVFDEEWKPRYGYFKDGPIIESGVGDYVAQSGDTLAVDTYHTGTENFTNPHPSYEFSWGIGEVVSALVRAGLTLDRLVEYPYMNGWRAFEPMRELDGDRLAPPETMPSLPLMYGIAAHK
ncbi:MAG TPA: methyltransferase domain-containing protein [Alcaligenes sp.]|nr:methyltransferase domain-containing protein [Alcaligenes sp.]HRL28082.1 methyltransferase domain-containing protein [Alcaligenes sp.]